MTESEYINQLQARWPKGCDASLEIIILADEAVRTFPKSPQLWCIRGNLIQLGQRIAPQFR